MTDTKPEIALIYATMLANRTPTQRVQAAFSLLFSAQELTKAGIREQNPNISDIDLRCAMFEKFYGSQLSQKTRANVVARLRFHDTNL